MTTLTSLYRDINLLLDMVEARMKQLQDLYEKKRAATTPVQSSTDVGNESDSSDEVNTRKTRRKVVVRDISATARFVSLPSGNILVFN